jgi:hypothetical protein
MSATSSGPKISQARRNQLETCKKQNSFKLVSYCLAYSLTLKVEAIFSSESSLDFQQTARRYMLKDKSLP